MKIGFLTEGRGEVPALPKLFAELKSMASIPVQYLHPVFVDVSPDAPAKLIARGVKPRLDALVGRGANKLVLVLDRESVKISAAKRAAEISTALTQHCTHNVCVIIKDRCIENWLIADPQAYRKQRALFPNAARIRYPSGRADNQDAEALIKAAIVNGNYDKMRHPEKILSKSSPAVMALNSKSFAQFVSVVSP